MKAVVGLGLVVLTSLGLILSTRCGNCDGQSISASANNEQPQTGSTASTAEIGQRQSLVVGGPALEGLAADSMSLDELVALGLAPDSTGDPVSDEAAPAETTADAETEAGTGTTEAGAGTTEAGNQAGSPASTIAGSSTATTKAGTGQTTTKGPTAKATSTTAPPTTASPAPVAVPVDPGSAPASGQVFYVSSSTGNDANDGKSSGKPWKSLQGAMKRVRAGQTILVMNGEYRELKAAGVAHYTVDVGGTAGNWVKIAAAPGHSPTIIASQGTGILIHRPYVEVSGLTIKGQGFNSSNHWGVGIAVTDTHHARVVGNRISGMPVSGISATGSSNFQLIGNVVSYNSYWSPLQGSGISVWHSTNRGFGADSAGYHDRIVGNRVYGNENKVFSGFYDYDTITDGNGIIVDSNQETGYSGRTLIANNLVYDNGGRGVIVWRSDHVDIMFNTSYHNGQTDGIAGGATELAAGRANDVKIANNVGWARPGLPAIIFDRVTNSSSYGNVLSSDRPSGDSSSNDLMHPGNPGFRNASSDPGTADFRPTANSVLKGRAQNAASIIGTDLVGTSRRSGTPDVGAFEAEAVNR